MKIMGLMGLEGFLEIFASPVFLDHFEREGQYAVAERKRGGGDGADQIAFQNVRRFGEGTEFNVEFVEMIDHRVADFAVARQGER